MIISKTRNKFDVVIPLKHRQAYECAVQQIQILEKTQDQIFNGLLEVLKIDVDSEIAGVIFDIAFNHPSQTYAPTPIKFK